MSLSSSLPIGNGHLLWQANLTEYFSFTLLTLMREYAIICIIKAMQKRESLKNDYGVDI